MKFIYTILFTISLSLFSETVIYTSGFIDVNSGTIKKNYSITVNNKIITSIDKGFIDIEKDDVLLDLRGKTLMPGLMDMHVHFGQEYQSKSERPVKVERETSAILASKHALKTLKAGFTTVRQVGDTGLIAISLRDLINSFQIQGPQIYPSGKVLLLQEVMLIQQMEKILTLMNIL